jgi:hypothetical protein
MHQGGNSLIINKLMASEAFKSMLNERYLVLKNSVFSVGSMKTIWDEYRELVGEEVPDQAERFGFPASMERWQSDMDCTEAFFTKRFIGFDQELQNVFELNAPEVKGNMVYPNPNNGTFFVLVFSENCSMMNVEVMNVLGQLVYKEECFRTIGGNIYRIETGLSSGLYLLRIENDIIRIVIQ